MKAQSLQVSQLPGLLRGKVSQCLDGGRLLVQPQEGEAVLCDVVDNGLGLAPLLVGDRVVFSRYADGLGGCVLGRLIAPDEAAERRSLRLTVDELVVDARTRVELGTDRARVLLAKDGRVQITADKLLSRARKVQRFLAPILRLN